MLTEIEWWGGLLIIWLCLTFYFLRLVFKDRQSVGVDEIAAGIVFVCAVSVFSLYFYTLDNLMLQGLYAGVTGLGLIMMVVMYVWPDPEDESDSDESEEEPEEELGFLLDVVSQLIIIMPFLLCFGFAAYKIKGYTELLALLT